MFGLPCARGWVLHQDDYPTRILVSGLSKLTETDVGILEQEAEGSLGGQAFWSLVGIFLVDSAEQRRLGCTG
jgi:predicted oxidoreductase